jgi:ribose/xylose/arabinose/galactoside ABC-type transport system permease subunit
MGMLMLTWLTYMVPHTSLGVGAVAAGATLIGVYLVMWGIIVKLKTPALLCTLAFLLIGRGSSLVLNAILHCSPGIWKKICGGKKGTFTISPAYFRDDSIRAVLCVLLVVLLAALLLWRYRSSSGLRHIAVGMDVYAAKIAGINSDHVYLIAFAVSGGLVAYAALSHLFTAAYGGWSPDTGWGYELRAITAAVLGGCRITGGRFNPIVVAIASIVYAGLSDLIIGMNLQVEAVGVIFGGALVVVAWLDTFTDRRQRNF